jgi:alcohol dehydrogenase
MAREATLLITEYLPKLVNNLKSLELREKLLYASMLADISIDSGSTHIIHAIEHVLSGLQPKLAHGYGLALLGPRAAYYIHKAVAGYTSTVISCEQL